METINLDSYKTKLADVVLDGKTYDVVSPNVETTLAISELSGKSQEQDMKVVMPAMIKIISLLVPTLPEEEIKKLPTGAIFELVTKISSLINPNAKREPDSKDDNKTDKKS